METKSELAKAIIKVMQDVKSIDKSMTVGSGSYSYKGVADKEVKQVYNKSMSDNGLCILPIGVSDITDVHRYVDQYSKPKMNVFTKVKTKYLLLHSSGESQEIAGYGHGIDSGDKGAGKATTYALKYALLYTFMTPTGNIDDSDSKHSEEIEQPETTEESVKEIINNATSIQVLTDWKGWITHFNLGDLATEKHKELKQ